MRITFVTPRYGAEIVGGAESAVRAFAIRLAARGHEVSVLTSTSRTIDWDDSLPAGGSTEDGVRVSRLKPVNGREPGFHHASRGWPPRALTGPEAAAGDFIEAQGPVLEDFEIALRSLDSDRVIGYPYLYWPILKAIEIAGEKSVLHPAAHPEPAIRQPSYRKLLPRARRIVYQTRAEQQLFERLFKVEGSKRLVLPLGIDPPVEKEAASSGNSGYFLMLGRVQADKGSLLVTELFRRVDLGHDLVLAGPVIDDPGKARRVRVLGEVSHQETLALLSGAVAVIVASRYESFSLVTVEAMAHSKPVIVNGWNPVLAEQVRDSNAGICFFGASDLAASLSIIARDQQLRDSLGNAGERYVTERLDWNQIISRYEAFIEDGGC